MVCKTPIIVPDCTDPLCGISNTKGPKLTARQIARMKAARNPPSPQNHGGLRLPLRSLSYGGHGRLILPVAHEPATPPERQRADDPDVGACVGDPAPIQPAPAERGNVEGQHGTNWTGRIAASLAIVVALSGGLWLSDKASGGTEPATAIATSCTGFKADAGKLFDNGDSTALKGTFAPGDHVHLMIDFKGAGYSWELTGALGKKPDVTSNGPFSKPSPTPTASQRTTNPRRHHPPANVHHVPWHDQRIRQAGPGARCGQRRRRRDNNQQDRQRAVVRKGRPRDVQSGDPADGIAKAKVVYCS